MSRNYVCKCHHILILDIDECIEGKHDCGTDELCIDLPPQDGKFECQKKCPQGLDMTADGTCVGESIDTDGRCLQVDL